MRARIWPAHDSAAGASCALAAARCVAELPEFVVAQTIALFAASRHEIATRPLFDRARASGKTVAFPRLLAEGDDDVSAIEFRAVADWRELAPGAFGILEPRADAASVLLDRADLVVVPGLAFDDQGARLGRGGGVYDRALARAVVPFRCGLAYAAQLVARVPTERWDERVDAVATERGVVRTESGRNRSRA